MRRENATLSSRRQADAHWRATPPRAIELPADGLLGPEIHGGAMNRAAVHLLPSDSNTRRNNGQSILLHCAIIATCIGDASRGLALPGTPRCCVAADDVPTDLHSDAVPAATMAPPFEHGSPWSVAFLPRDASRPMRPPWPRAKARAGSHRRSSRARTLVPAPRQSTRVATSTAARMGYAAVRVPPPAATAPAKPLAGHQQAVYCRPTGVLGVSHRGRSSGSIRAGGDRLIAPCDRIGRSGEYEGMRGF